MGAEGEVTEDDGADAAAPRHPEPLRLTVNKVSWAQVGRVAEPGRYMYRFGWLTITAADLAIWKQFPTAAFTLVRTAATIDAEDIDAAEGFRLGTFELRENLSLSER